MPSCSCRHFCGFTKSSASRRSAALHFIAESPRAVSLLQFISEAAPAVGPPWPYKHGSAIPTATVRQQAQRRPLADVDVQASIPCRIKGQSSGDLLLPVVPFRAARVQVVGPSLHHLRTGLQVLRMIVGRADVISLLVRQL